jgi:hypothetical protein
LPKMTRRGHPTARQSIPVLNWAEWLTRKYVARGAERGHMTTYGLHIDGAMFPLVSSEFGGHLLEPGRHARHYGHVPLRIRWYLSLGFATGRLNHEDAWEIEPVFETHDGFDPGISDWRDFGGKTVRWHDARQFGAPVGNAYVYEHADIYEAALVFSARDGARFEIHWSGLCDIHATALLSKRVPFRIAANITFEGITVECRASESMADVWRRLTKFADTSSLSLPVLKTPPDTNGGVGLVLFRPKA